jgi:hypothetical protein
VNRGHTAANCEKDAQELARALEFFVAKADPSEQATLLPTNCTSGIGRAEAFRCRQYSFMRADTAFRSALLGDLRPRGSRLARSVADVSKALINLFTVVNSRRNSDIRSSIRFSNCFIQI